MRKVSVLGPISLDMSNRFAPFDAQMIFGTGVEYQVDSELAIVAHLRYNLGLVDIDTSADRFYSRGIQLMFGAKFGL
ncbi:hypothetical protein K2X33_14565, partial [bacterium]|nr:hypothetical protein [bacterium]